MMRYLPFIFISLLLYTWFFSNSQQPELLSPSANKKIVVIDFEKIAQQDKQQAEAMAKPIPPVHTERKAITPEPSATEQDLISNTAVVAPVVVEKEVASVTPSPKRVIQVAEAKPKVVKEAAPVAQLPSPVSPKIKQYQVSIATSPAIDAALLKAIFFEQYIYSFQPAQPINKQPVARVKKQRTSTVNKPPIHNKQEKTKRSFKPVNQPIPIKLSLPEAIAISGNTPHYPQQAQADKKQGMVTVKLTVNMQGKSKSPQIINSSGHAILDNAVLDFIKKERFMPALEGNEKVTREQHYSFKFELK